MAYRLVNLQKQIALKKYMEFAGLKIHFSSNYFNKTEFFDIDHSDFVDGKKIVLSPVRKDNVSMQQNFEGFLVLFQDYCVKYTHEGSKPDAKMICPLNFYQPAFGGKISLESKIILGTADTGDGLLQIAQIVNKSSVNPNFRCQMITNVVDGEPTTIKLYPYEKINDQIQEILF